MPSTLSDSTARVAHVSSPLISLRSVDAGYRNSTVLHDVTLSVSRDSFTGIVGPSGAGKTTLLRLLLGSMKPQRGGNENLAKETTYWDTTVPIKNGVIITPIGTQRYQ